MGTRKKKRPITRKFWDFLKILPQFIRAPFLRNQFKVPLWISGDIILKQAETEEEITQALQLVYESYTELNYIDPNAVRLRLTKFHLLPTTVILIVVKNKEVIGTMSIIRDSTFKLPSDQTWDLSSLRKNGAQIAEISSLTISKKTDRRVSLLLPLCKLMYEYCKNILKVDGIVVSTVIEVECFYTDVLLFRRISLGNGEKNWTVKGTPSTCCFLSFRGTEAEENYKKIYGHRPEEYNLYNFFVEKKIPNIHLPQKSQSLQTYTVKQTASFKKIFDKYPDLKSSFTQEEIRAIQNLDPGDLFRIKKDLSFSKRPKNRFALVQGAKCYFLQENKLVDCVITNISASGLHFNLKESAMPDLKETNAVLVFSTPIRSYTFYLEIAWSSNNRSFGCKLTKNDCLNYNTNNSDWRLYFSDIQSEYLENCQTSRPVNLKTS